MSFLRKALHLVLFGSSMIMYSQYTDVINSNRPGESMGAFAVGKTIFQTELGVSYIREDHNLLGYKASGYFTDIDFRYGFLLEELEFIADIQYRKDTYEAPFADPLERSALKNTVFGFKYLFYDPFKNYKEKVNVYSWKANQKFKWRQLVPAVSLYAGANLVFSNNVFTFEGDPILSPKIMIILQNHFSGGWVFVSNIIADRITTDYPTVGGIFTVTKSFNEKWSGFAEYQAYQSDYYADILVRAGAAYLANDNLQLDFSIGKNFKYTPDIFYGGIGLSWRFTINYKDVILKDDIKPDSSSKKEKKSEEKQEETIEEAPQE
jgi:hypothetical protein